MGASVQGQTSVLVVDDNPAVLAMCRRMLEDGGYKVYEAAGVQEALEVLSVVKDIKVVVSDVRMPQNGWGLATRLASRMPPVSILFISGFASSLADLANITGVGRLLSKPFTEEQLLDSVRQTLAMSA
jgi:two-component system cell cycle sensor histidine kinase/response regulator CckA